MAALGHAAGAQSLPAAPIVHEQPSLSDLGQLSIEELANLPVTSVAKRAEPISQAPAAIFVITHDDIERSGATSIPEMLRLAPNLQVAQSSAGKYVITARGLSGNQAQQSFTDKLLVLIDGRSVYTPLYSGVYWDMQDVLPADIDRIEVISGPGATLWGANAFNGVINIITRKTSETQGALVEAGGGNLQQAASLRYGGKIGDSVSWRVYAKTFFDRGTVTPSGASGGDHWTRPQGGFRLDFAPTSTDQLTVQGDAYQGTDSQTGAADEIITGRNILGRWNHDFQGAGALQIQAYYDHASRKIQSGGGQFKLDTLDLDVQHSFSVGARNDVVWGGGVRSANSRINGNAILFFDPANRTLNLANVFVQDTFAFDKATRLVLGLKLENDPYSGMAVLPNLRLSHSFNEGAMLWAAASRAIRTPTPFDEDVQEKFGGVLFLRGADIEPEAVTAYEVGGRAYAFSRLSFSVSGFYNVYGDLRTIEVSPQTQFLPLQWGNGLKGDTWGVEAWGDYQAAAWWRLSAGFNLLWQRFEFEPGSSKLLGFSQAGDDPPHQAILRSSMNLGHRITWEVDGRYVGALPDPALPAYGEINTSIAWSATDHIRLQVTGANLLHDHHQELPGVNAVPRSVYASLRWSF
jgi:iron complex outermembrane receptor protein